MHSNRLLRWSRIPAAKKRKKAGGGEREKNRMDGGKKIERGLRGRWRKEKEE